MSIHLSPQETSGLVTRCRQHGAAVTGALTAAFLLAQEDVRPGGRSAPRRVSVALNMRDRLLHPPGPVVGVHASTVDISLRFRAGTSFWELARLAHTRIHAAINDLPRIHRPLVLEELDPRIVDSLLPPISTDRWPRGFGFLTHFLPLRGDVRRLDVSNIGRLTLPDEGVPFRLEAIHPLPPLVPGCGMEISSVTWNNRMNITVNYRKSVWDDAIMQQVRVRALEYLAM